jgi:hypothetical protein
MLGSFKTRPRLLDHQFWLERQNVLLLGNRGALDALREQEGKVDRLVQFLQFLHNSLNELNGETHIILKGLDMLLRAVKIIKSSSKQRLILKICDLKLKVLVSCPTTKDSINQIEECFTEYLKNFFDDGSFDLFVQYYGFNPVLDGILTNRMVESMSTLSFEERVKLCEKVKDHIAICGSVFQEVLKILFESIRSIDNWSLLRKFGVQLIELIIDSASGDYCMLIFQSNRLEFMRNSQIFDSFLNFLTLEIAKDASTQSLVTSFNSKIRSFLGRPEARCDEVLQSCAKFVLQFYDLDIGCIRQFADFLLKFQLIPSNSVSSAAFPLIFRLFKLHSLKIPSPETFSMFFNVCLSSNEKKLQLISFLLQGEFEVISGDHVLLTYSDVFDETFMKMVSLFVERFLHFKEEACFMADVDSFEIPEKVQSDNLNSCLSILQEAILPVYLKRFRSDVTAVLDDPTEISVFTRTFSLVTGLLLKCGSIKWTDLSAVLGPNAVASVNNSIFGRSICVQVYTTWLKLDLSEPSSSMLRSVLSPQNTVDLWLKCLLDFEEYGQIEFFNEYYELFLVDRISCFKGIISFLAFVYSLIFLVFNLPAKFIFEFILRNTDFKSSVALDSDWWNFMLKIGEYLIDSSDNNSLRGVIFALFSKHLPLVSFELIVKVYELSWRNVKEFYFSDLEKTKRNLLLRYTENDPIAFLTAIRGSKGNVSRGFAIAACNEFLGSEAFTGNTNVFVCQIVCAKVLPCLLLDREEIDSFCRGLKDVKMNCNWTVMFRSLYLLTELGILPNSVEELMKFLCSSSGIEGYEEFFSFTKGLSFSQEVLLSDSVFTDANASFSAFKLNLSEFVILPSGEIDSFVCLAQLLKLLLQFDENSVWLLTSYLRKKMNTMNFNERERGKFDYFNILFP